MSLAESQALLLAQHQAVEMYSEDHRFTAADVCSLHRLWLGPIYAWAGEYRNVNIGKGGLQFAVCTCATGAWTDGRLAARPAGAPYTLSAHA